MNERSIAQQLQDVFWRAGETLMLRHTNPWELDAALVAWGYAIGPCEAQDLLGLERVLERDTAGRLPILPRMVAEGRMGKIGGVGYYRYPGGGGAVIDPLIEDLIREEAWFAKIERAERDDLFLIQAMNAALVPVVRQLYDEKVRDITGHLARAVHFPRGRINALMG